MAKSSRLSLSKPAPSKINKAPSSVLAITLPWVLVMLGSLSPAWPIIASSPHFPPLGYLFLLAWLQMRPGLFPVWAGLPLGLFDDLYSGQPFGSGILLWSLTTVLLDFVDVRLPWRGFVQNWLVAAGLVAGYLLVDAIIATGLDGVTLVWLQIGFAVLLYPIAGSIVGKVDKLRLVSFRTIG